MNAIDDPTLQALQDEFGAIWCIDEGRPYLFLEGLRSGFCEIWLDTGRIKHEYGVYDDALRRINKLLGVKYVNFS